MSSAAGKLLFVDLDGTLTHSDLLAESFLELIKRNLLYVLLVPFWLMRGKAHLKQKISERVTVRVDLLPYNQELLDYLHAEKAAGKRLVLVSATSQRIVEQVAHHLGIFEAAMGSGPDQNCSGSNKLQCIHTYAKGDSFVYAGNAHVDLKVWKEAEGAVLVSASPGLKKKAAALTRVVAEFDHRYGTLAGVANRVIKAMRLHQWLKNTLIFLPLALSHDTGNVEMILRAMVAFLCFGLCASSVYILNDLLDLPADRQHHSKQRRPFASGDLPPQLGLLLSPILLLLAFLIATRLPLEFMLILGGYYFCTCLYSFVLKKIELVDVITLATLYTARIIAGAAAISVIPTFWLLAFSMFLFMSLAIVKRYTELSALRASGMSHTEGRGYLASDLDIMAIFGCTSGLMSVMVFALYINSDDTLLQYSTPEILWFICPLLLYLICRIWMLAFRGEIEDDPIVFALTDGISQAVTFVCIALLWMATINWPLL